MIDPNVSCFDGSRKGVNFKILSQNFGTERNILENPGEILVIGPSSLQDDSGDTLILSKDCFPLGIM